MPTTPLLDRLEIDDLVSRLGACLDEHRFADLADLLTEDATVATPGGESSGRAGVVAQATRNHEASAHVQHLITNVLVDLDGDQAEARANLVVTFAGEDGRPTSSLGEVYRFGVRRTPGGWRLARIEVRPRWRTDHG